jgi:hydrogenase expression/formation protein HypC
MCLAIPMKIIKINGDKAEVVARGLKRKISLAFLKQSRCGDYVLIHAGFAIEKLDANTAKETLGTLGLLEDELR